MISRQSPVGSITGHKRDRNSSPMRTMHDIVASDNRLNLGGATLRVIHLYNLSFLCLAEIDQLLKILAERKRRLESTEKEVEYEVLSDFLARARSQRMEVRHCLFVCVVCCPFAVRYSLMASVLCLVSLPSRPETKKAVCLSVCRSGGHPSAPRDRNAAGRPAPSRIQAPGPRV